MAFRIDLTLDCANPAGLAEFWKLALGYEDQPLPAPFDRLSAAGATALQEFPGHHVVMADPEGNVFCEC